MDALLIVAATVVAVLIVFRTIAPSGKPSFTVVERVPTRGLSASAGALGKACARTERGKGVSAARVCRGLKKNIKEISRRSEREKWEIAFIENADMLLGAAGKAKQALRKSYMLGHVRAKPRIFLLCKEIAEKTRGYADIKLFAELVARYSAAAPLSVAECGMLGDMLVYCLCGMINAAADGALRRGDSYRKGAADGRIGRADLDRIASDDYICGLADTASDSNAVSRMAENNGIDINSAAENRRRYLAETYALVVGAADTVRTFTELPDHAFMRLSEAYAVLEKSAGYSTASEKDKADTLRSVAATAKKRGLSEAAFAEECVEYAAVSGESVERYAVEKPRLLLTMRYVLPLSAAALFTALLSILSEPISAAFFALSFAVSVTAFYRLARALSTPYYVPRRIGVDARSILLVVTGAEYLIQRTGMLRAVGRRLDSSVKNRRLAALYAKLLSECMTVASCAAAQLFGAIFVARWFSWTALAVASSACLSIALVGLFACGAELSLKPLRSVLAAAMSFAAIPSAAALAAAVCLLGKNAKRLYAPKTSRALFASSAAAQIAAGIAVTTVGAVFCPPMTAVGCVFALFPLAPFCVAKINSALSDKPKTTQQRTVRNERTSTDGAPFGGEPQAKLCLVNGGGAYIACDNRGDIRVSDCAGGVPRARYRLGAVCTVGGYSFDLAHCGGVFQKHKAIYRAVSSGAQFVFEAAAATELSACACMITLVNRTGAPVAAELLIYVAPIACRDAASLRAIGITVGGEAIAGASDKPVAVKHAVVLGAFEKKRIPAAVVLGADVRGAEQMLPVAQSDMFYEYAEACARGYADGDLASVVSALFGDRECAAELCDPRLPTLVYSADDRNALTEINELKRYGYDVNAFLIDERSDYGVSHKGGVRVLYGSRDGDAIATARRIATKRRAALAESACEPAFGINEPALAVKPCLRRPQRATGLDMTRNIVTDGGLYSVFDEYGAAGGCCAVDGARAELPRAFVAIEENGVVWSPTVRPCGKGVMSTRHSAGRTEYDCAYNGALARMRVYAARGALGIVYDLEIENTCGEERDLFVMFAAEAPLSMRPARTAEMYGGSIVLSKVDGNGYAVFASEEIAERAFTAQAYRSFGAVRRAHGFSAGGDDTALALSVALRVKADGKKRVVFLLAAKVGDLFARRIDIAAADGYIEDSIAFWSRLGAVRLYSSDEALNAAYKTALYSAYVNAARRDIDGDAVGALAAVYAVKYADPSAAVSRIVAACSEQTESGRFSCIDGGSHRVLKTLLLPLAAADIAEFSGDASIFDVEAPFATPDRRDDRVVSVFEHCLRAIDAAAADICSADGIDAAALYAALGMYSFRCDGERKKRYRELMKNMWFVGNYRLGDENALRRLLGDGVLFETVFALSLYESGDPSAAYCALGRAVSSGREKIADDYAASILFYATVTEKLLGIAVRGTKADIDPRTADVTPHIDFSYDCDGAVTRIAVDDSIERGEWQMSVGRITYAHAKIDLEKGSDGVIVFRRCEPHH